LIVTGTIEPGIYFIPNFGSLNPKFDEKFRN